MGNTHFNHPGVDYDDTCVACLQARVAELESQLRHVCEIDLEAFDALRSRVECIREVAAHPHLNSIEKMATIDTILTQA